MKKEAGKCNKNMSTPGRYQKCLWYGSIVSCSVIAAVNLFWLQYGKF